MYIGIYGVPVGNVILLGLAVTWGYIHLCLGVALRKRAAKRAGIQQALRRPGYTLIRPT
jgi:hypothetical protein